MIHVDPRAGSGQFRDYLNNEVKFRGKKKIAMHGQLPFGDFFIPGNGPEGRITVGVELKRVADLIQCMKDGRLTGHQIPGMLRMYDWSVLLVYDEWQGKPQTGILQVKRGRKWVEVDYHSAAAPRSPG